MLGLRGISLDEVHRGVPRIFLFASCNAPRCIRSDALANKGEKIMQYILLGGAIFNFFGAISIIVLYAALPASQRASPPDYAQYRLFTAGAAFTFSAIYFYLFQNPQYAIPFLLFGMSLKFWAFVVSLYAYLRCGLSSKDLFRFGISNLIFAVLFAVYLLS